MSEATPKVQAGKSEMGKVRSNNGRPQLPFGASRQAYGLSSRQSSGEIVSKRNRPGENRKKKWKEGFEGIIRNEVDIQEKAKPEDPISKRRRGRDEEYTIEEKVGRV